MFAPFFLFTIGVMFAITFCTIWGKMGGDKEFEYHHSKFRKILRTIHHWMFGLTLIAICPLFVLLSPILIPVYFILGLGLGLFLDDVIFHNFECYFERQKE